MDREDPTSGSSTGRDLGRRTLNDPPPAGLGITPVPTDEDPSRTGTLPPPVPPGRAPAPPPPSGPAGGPPPPPPEPYRPVLEPSPTVAQYLFDSERYCGEWRRHWIHIARWIAAAAGGTLLLGYIFGALSQVPYVLGVVSLLWVVLLVVVGYYVADWYHDRFVLTNKRVMLIEGIFTRQVGMMPLIRITDMAYKQSPLGRTLNYGTFILESAGQEQALREIAPLPYPNELYLLFCQVMYDPDEVFAVSDDGD